MSKFQIFKGTNSQFYYRLRAAGNNEIILSGEGYTTKQSCLDGIDSVKRNAPIDARYDRKDNLGNYRFNLKAANGEIIGVSEGYSTITNRENGISSVKRNAPIATIEDLT